MCRCLRRFAGCPVAQFECLSRCTLPATPLAHFLILPPADVDLFFITCSPLELKRVKLTASPGSDLVKPDLMFHEFPYGAPIGCSVSIGDGMCWRRLAVVATFRSCLTAECWALLCFCISLPEPALIVLYLCRRPGQQRTLVRPAHRAHERRRRRKLVRSCVDSCVWLDFCFASSPGLRWFFSFAFTHACPVGLSRLASFSRVLACLDDITGCSGISLRTPSCRRTTRCASLLAT